jgi:hypothetical protein
MFTPQRQDGNDTSKYFEPATLLCSSALMAGKLEKKNSSDQAGQL